MVAVPLIETRGKTLLALVKTLNYIECEQNGCRGTLGARESTDSLACDHFADEVCLLSFFAVLLEDR
jgi:hypothetical protein